MDERTGWGTELLAAANNKIKAEFKEKILLKAKFPFEHQVWSSYKAKLSSL